MTAVEADLPAAVVLPLRLVRAHDPVALADAVLLDGPAVPATGARAVSARDHVQAGIDEEGRLVDLFLLVLIGLGVGYTALAVANTLLMATAARRPEFRALRLTGAATGQLLRLTTAEALLAVALGTVLGLVVAGVSLLGMRVAIEQEIGVDVPLVVPWGPAGAVTAVCAVVAVLAAAAPLLRRR